MGDIFEEYALVVSQIEALEEKKDQLRPHILQMLIDRGETKKETGMGTFSVSKLKKWIYPPVIAELEDNLKEAKAKAQSTKEATYEEVPSLKFNKLSL